MELTLSKWDLMELAQKITEANCDGSVSIPIFEVDESEFQVVCEFNLHVHYDEREDNTGWQNVDIIDFCVTNMYVACDGEPIDMFVDWDESTLNEFVRDNIYD